VLSRTSSLNLTYPRKIPFVCLLSPPLSPDSIPGSLMTDSHLILFVLSVCPGATSVYSHFTLRRTSMLIPQPLPLGSDHKWMLSMDKHTSRGRLVIFNVNFLPLKWCVAHSKKSPLLHHQKMKRRKLSWDTYKPLLYLKELTLMQTFAKRFDISSKMHIVTRSGS